MPPFSILFILREALGDFEAHARVVIGALPESGFIVCSIYFAVLTTPMPLSSFIVNNIIFDIRP
jgi:hypothetical protein